MGIFGGGLGKLLQTGVMGTDYMAAKAKRDQQAAFVADLIARTKPGYAEGPDVQVTVPEAGQAAEVPKFQLPQRTRDPIDINSPDLPGLATRAQQLGVPITSLLDVLKAQQPDVHYDRGYGYNAKTGAAAGGYHTELDKGMQPGADGTVSNAPGFVRSAAESAGAVTGAQEQQKAAYDIVEIPQRDGSTIKLPRLIASQILSRRFGDQGPGAGDGFGQSQTPSEASAAKIVGDARATAKTTLPNDLNTVDTAIESATSLLKHPALDHRTGLWSVLPAVPGTPGASFEAYKKQVLGQSFLDARTALKGGGQITDYEGKNAQQAKVRMEAAQTPEDFKTALTDYIGALKRGRTILQDKAGGLAPEGAATPRPAAGPRTTGFRSRIISAE